MYNYELSTVNKYFQEAEYQIKCVDDESPISPLFRQKGNAGVMTLWHKEKDQHIIPLIDGSSRVIVTQLGVTANPVFLINTYMPTAGSANQYNIILDEVHEIIQKYQAQGNIIWMVT
jgi:exonuclease III